MILMVPTAACSRREQRVRRSAVLLPKRVRSQRKSLRLANDLFNTGIVTFTVRVAAGDKIGIPAKADVHSCSLGLGASALVYSGHDLDHAKVDFGDRLESRRSLAVSSRTSPSSSVRRGLLISLFLSFVGFTKAYDPCGARPDPGSRRQKGASAWGSRRSGGFRCSIMPRPYDGPPGDALDPARYGADPGRRRTVAPAAPRQ